MKKLLKQYGGRGMSLEQLAKNGLLPDRLEFNDICKLCCPDNKQDRYALYQALWKAYKEGDLKGEKKERKRQTTYCMKDMHGMPIDPNFRPRYKTTQKVWVERDDYQAFLKHVGEWPLEKDNMLTSWFGEYKVPTSDKRESDLPRYVSDVIKEMIKDGNEKPTYKEIWHYIDRYQNELEWVDEMTDETLYWVTMLGKINPITLNAFRKTVTKAKKLLEVPAN